MPGGASKTMDRYLELEEQGNVGLETRIYGQKRGDSSSDLEIDDTDDGSQKGIVGSRKRSETALRVQVKRDFNMEITGSNQQI